MKLSVVILNYNVRYFLELCLRSVIAATQNMEAEVIVVDNNSSDDSCKMVRQLFPSVLLIENTDNLGFSKGNNIGVKQAIGEYVCILNPDTVVSESTFSHLIQFADDIKDLGIVGCQLIDGRGKFLPESKRNIPKPYVSLMKMLGNSTAYYANQVTTEDTREVDIQVGAFMFLKREVYNTVGGFDEDYFMYGEDIDLSYKIKKSGLKNYYKGDVSCIHYKGESTLKDANYAKRFYGAMQIFYRKHFKRNLLFNGLVWFGIKLAYALRGKIKLSSPLVERYVIVSDRKINHLHSKLDQSVSYMLDLKALEPNSCVIFDGHYCSYESIIIMMKENALKENITYRILPKNTNFTIGSNSAIYRGEVLHF